MPEGYLVGGVRTPQGKYGGARGACLMATLVVEELEDRVVPAGELLKRAHALLDRMSGQGFHQWEGTR